MFWGYQLPAVFVEVPGRFMGLGESTAWLSLS